MLRVCLVGCGSIGGFVARAVEEGKCGSAKLVGVFDSNFARAQALSSSSQGKPMVAKNLEELLACKPNLVVDAASQQAVRECGEKVLASGSSLLVMSVGALLDEKLRALLKAAEKKGNSKLLLPSGAIGALDALRSAAVGRIDSVVLTSRKPAESLGFAGLPGERIVFEGSARLAVKKFPFNVNVAAALSLAGIGPDKTRVKIIADPGVKNNVHEIEASGEFGRFVARFENKPSKHNAKTSALAAFSAVAKVKEFAEESLQK